MSRIIELRAENFKRLKAVAIPLAPGLNEITGRNAQGKSSVLDVVLAALAGADGCPDDPIRHGASSGETYLDLGDLRVTRTWTQGKDGKPTATKLKVEQRAAGDEDERLCQCSGCRIARESHLQRWGTP